MQNSITKLVIELVGDLARLSLRGRSRKKHAAPPDNAPAAVSEPAGGDPWERKETTPSWEK